MPKIQWRHLFSDLMVRNSSLTIGIKKWEFYVDLNYVYIDSDKMPPIIKTNEKIYIKPGNCIRKLCFNFVWGIVTKIYLNVCNQQKSLKFFFRPKTTYLKKNKFFPLIKTFLKVETTKPKWEKITLFLKYSSISFVHPKIYQVTFQNIVKITVPVHMYEYTVFRVKHECRLIPPGTS